MAIRGIREYDGKKLMTDILDKYSDTPLGLTNKYVLVEPETDLNKLPEQNKWLSDIKLVVKPDMLFGKRGKNNLILLNATYEEAKKWIEEKRSSEVEISGVKGFLTHFLIEPFTPHQNEFYIAIRSFRDGDVVYFSRFGGVEVEENWDKVTEVKIPVMEDKKLINFNNVDVQSKLPLEGKEYEIIGNFVNALYKFYADQGFAYLEINPFTIINDKVVPLDLVAKLDDTAAFENLDTWGRSLNFPVSFGKKLTPEEAKIKALDEKTGASLKLTILNPDGRIWPMVAGGGASVIYADTVSDLGYIDELAMYGEYSGNPNTELTYQYASTVLDLMTRKPIAGGKVWLIGGGIANFTDVAKTFTGIIQAIEEYADKLKENKVSIFVRRGGPNYKTGLQKMRDLGKKLDLPIEVFGPETHMTKIVGMGIDVIKNS